MEELFGAGGEVGRVELAREGGEIRGLGDEAREGGGGEGLRGEGGHGEAKWFSRRYAA